MSEDGSQAAQAPSTPVEVAQTVPPPDHNVEESLSDAPTSDRVGGYAIQTLVQVALEQDDPVTALDEGAEALAEALARRDLAEAAHARELARQRSDDLGAYRHARMHRVTELVDLGYQLDQAIAITNANEAEIRARAATGGRDPMDLIREYAVRNGYGGQTRRGEQGGGVRTPSPIEALAAMSDEAFAKATQGDAWRRLMSVGPR